MSCIKTEIALCWSRKKRIIKDVNKKGVESIVLYYHERNLFDEKRLKEGYNSYLRNSKSKRIQNVYYIVDRNLFKL